jgi:ParB family transcriptional regulator, chromosome partitioning protein
MPVAQEVRTSLPSTVPARQATRAKPTRPSAHPRSRRESAKTRDLEIRYLPVAQVEGSPHNPRRRLQGVDELAASLQAHGLLQPVVVRRVGDHYVLVAGHRRTEAARMLGWETIPAIVRDAAEDEAYLLTLVENLQRQDLSPREESAALEVLVRERGWNTRQVATAIERSPAFVSKRLRVFEDPVIGPAVVANELSVSAAEELLSVAPKQRGDLLAQAIRGKWDMARVRQAARSARFGPKQKAGERRPGLSRRVQDLRIELRDVELPQLRESDRRQLRLLFSELTILARARPSADGKRIFPPLPRVSSSGRISR